MANLVDMMVCTIRLNWTLSITYNVPIEYVCSAIAFPLFFLCLGSGLRTHLGIQGGWRLASLAILTAFAVVAFIVVQSALVMGTFDPDVNPITRCYLGVLPRFWGF
jgi:hypothetical protein